MKRNHFLLLLAAAIIVGLAAIYFILKFNLFVSREESFRTAKTQPRMDANERE